MSNMNSNSTNTNNIIINKSITSNRSTNEPSVYIIINDNLKMSKGKIIAQSAHGILKMNRFLMSNEINHQSWLTCGEKIVALKADLSIINELMITYAEQINKSNTLNVFPIYDAGRTQVESGSLTVLITTPITLDKKPEILSKLSLF